jgi:hypothetical protein
MGLQENIESNKIYRLDRMKYQLEIKCIYRKQEMSNGCRNGGNRGLQSNKNREVCAPDTSSETFSASEWVRQVHWVHIIESQSAVERFDMQAV